MRVAKQCAKNDRKMALARDCGWLEERAQEGLISREPTEVDDAMMVAFRPRGRWLPAFDRQTSLQVPVMNEGPAAAGINKTEDIRFDRLLDWDATIETVRRMSGAGLATLQKARGVCRDTCYAAKLSHRPPQVFRRHQAE
ncbi:hypothetical protein GCM10022290_18240 [Sagittula marina]